MRKILLAASILGVLLAAPPARADWLQWGRTPQHGGFAPVAGQPLQAILADIVYDPFVEQMKAEANGSLLAHYAVPLVDDSGVYMIFKTGTYAGFGNWDSITWTVRKLRRNGGVFETVWTFASDWKPEPLSVTAWESVFLPAISGDRHLRPGPRRHRLSREPGDRAVAGPRQPVHEHRPEPLRRRRPRGRAGRRRSLQRARPRQRPDPGDRSVARPRRARRRRVARRFRRRSCPEPRPRRTSAPAPSRRTSARGRRRRPPCRRRRPAARSGRASTSFRRSRPTGRSTPSAARTSTTATATSSPSIRT